MKILLDTSYFLPLIGISIKGIPRDTILLFLEENEVYISEITIFELSAKAAKYFVKNILPLHRFTRGLKALIYDERIEIIPLYDDEIHSTAFKIRKIVKDYIDCLILSTALNYCELMVTEDEDLLNLREDDYWKKIKEEVNKDFKIVNLEEYRSSIRKTSFANSS